MIMTKQGCAYCAPSLRDRLSAYASHAYRVAYIHFTNFSYFVARFI